MERRNNFDSPRKQSPIALLLIVYNRFKQFISRLWPIILIAIVSGGNSTASGPDKYTLTFIAIALISAISGIIAYFRYFFWIEDDQLIIKKGIFNKSETQIPFDRIQTIDFEQNLIQQAFGVVGLKIETAGSQKSELKMQALEIDVANGLREFILSNKSQSMEGALTDSVLVEEKEEEIYAISFPSLIKIGLTENHLRSVFAILFGLYWIYETVKDAGLDADGYRDSMEGTIIGNIILIAILVFFFIVISVGFSVVRVFLTYFELKLLRRNNGFKLVSGLFNKKEIAAVDKKIQLISWKQNALQKLLKFHTLQMNQASSVQLSTKKAIIVPGLDSNDISKIKNYLFPDRAEDGIEYLSVDRYYFLRPITYTILLSVIGCIAFYYFGQYTQIFILLLAGLFYSINRYKKYKKASYGINEKAIFMKGGVFGDSQWFIMHHKIQSLEINQTPFQRRKSLADLIIHTASGSKVVPYISLAKANYLYDYISYKVESSKLEWM